MRQIQEEMEAERQRQEEAERLRKLEEERLAEERRMLVTVVSVIMTTH